MPFVIHISIIPARLLITRAATYHTVEPINDTKSPMCMRHLESEESYMYLLSQRFAETPNAERDSSVTDIYLYSA